MKPWRRIDSRRIHDCRVFDLERVRFVSPEGGSPREYFVIEAPDWVNVIPLTDDGCVLMVRQYRFGIGGVTLEIPGGMCDGGEDPASAAARELAEETGFRAGSLVELGWVHPNPPIQNNRCHTFLARALAPGVDARPDADERLELVRVPLDSIPRRIADGSITHALVLAAFHLLDVNGRPAGVSPTRS